MLGKRISKLFFATARKEVVPKPPKLLSGELEPFKFDFENQQLYDGYSLDELYGSKVGVQFPPAIRAEMMKYFWPNVRDNIAVGLIFIVGMGLIWYYNEIFHTELKCIDRVQEAKISRVVELPPRYTGDLLWSENK